MYDFGYLKDDKFIPFSISCIKSTPLWRILSNRNREVGVFDWLFAWPPEKINGFMVTLNYRGMSPFSMAYPKDITLSYSLPSIDGSKINFTSDEQYIEFVTSIEKYKENLFLKLKENYNADFLAYVSYLPDDLQHFYYSYMEPYYFDVREEEVKKYGNTIVEGYKLLDDFLGNFIDNENITLIIVSDHGFHRSDITAGPILVRNFQPFGRYKHIVFRMNYFLYKIGFLSFDEERGEEINFSQTRAYFCNNLTLSGICIISRDRQEKIKIAKEISEILTNTKLENGEKIFLNVSITNNPNDGPDLIFKINPILLEKENFEIECNNTVFYKPLSIKHIIYKDAKIGKIVISNNSFGVNELIDFTQLPGNHQINGIIIMKGKNIKKNFTIQKIYPIDIAPTILYLLKEKIPTYMEGKVLTEAINEEYLVKNPVVYIEEKEISPNIIVPEIWKGEEFEAIKERLKELGYLK